MSEPKRYALRLPEISYGTEESVNGEYVLHSDYARLKAEVERLRKLGTEMGKHLPDTDEANRAYIDFEAGGKS